MEGEFEGRPGEEQKGEAAAEIEEDAGGEKGDDGESDDEFRIGQSSISHFAKEWVHGVDPHKSVSDAVVKAVGDNRLRPGSVVARLQRSTQLDGRRSPVPSPAKGSGNHRTRSPSPSPSVRSNKRGRRSRSPSPAT
jgi:hypothetical protein